MTTGFSSARAPVIHAALASLALLSLSFAPPAPAQSLYRDTEGEYYVVAAPCHTTVMEFFDSRAPFPYFEVDGYYFNANPFQTTRWTNGNHGMVMRSSKAYYSPHKGRYVVDDASGKYRWVDPLISVSCYQKQYLWGLMTVPYAIVTATHGYVEPKELACGGGSGETELAEVVYEPGYDPYGGAPNGGGCGDETGDGGNGGSGGSGTQYQPGDNTGGETVDWGTGEGNGGTSVCGATAVVEYVCIDYWDGDSWEEWSCGYATTC